MALLLFITVAPVTAEDKEQSAVFVDLDGDGFHDSATDTDNDGIPDMGESESETLSEGSGMQAQTMNLFADPPPAATVETHTSWRAGFGLRRIAALGLGANRCDFDAASGNGDNLSAGGAGGGACAGGVCLPR